MLKMIFGFLLVAMAVNAYSIEFNMGFIYGIGYYRSPKNLVFAKIEVIDIMEEDERNGRFLRFYIQKSSEYVFENFEYVFEVKINRDLLVKMLEKCENFKPKNYFSYTNDNILIGKDGDIEIWNKNPKFKEKYFVDEEETFIGNFYEIMQLDRMGVISYKKSLMELIIIPQNLIILLNNLTNNQLPSYY